MDASHSFSAENSYERLYPFIGCGIMHNEVRQYYWIHLASYFLKNEGAIDVSVETKRGRPVIVLDFNPVSNVSSGANLPLATVRLWRPAKDENVELTYVTGVNDSGRICDAQTILKHVVAGLPSQTK
jgi:hypothetical protein